MAVREKLEEGLEFLDVEEAEESVQIESLEVSGYLDEWYTCLEKEIDRMRRGVDAFQDFIDEYKQQPVSIGNTTREMDTTGMEIYRENIYSKGFYHSEAFEDIEESIEEEIHPRAVDMLDSKEVNPQQKNFVIEKTKENGLRRRLIGRESLKNEKENIEELEFFFKVLYFLEDEHWRYPSKDIQSIQEYSENMLERRKDELNSSESDSELVHGNLEYIYRDAEVEYPYVKTFALAIEKLEDWTEDLEK